MRVLVAGAGIAGITTAVALHEAGIEAVVHESYPRTAEGVGSWLQLASNGVDALAAVGLAAPVEALGFPTPDVRMHDHTGRRTGMFPITAPGGRHTTRALRRPDLYAALRDAATARGIAVRYGARVTDARRTADGVEAVLADGSTADGDLLVAADGIGSALRTRIDPAAPPARYTGLLSVGGYAHDVDLPARYRSAPGVLHFRFGRRCFLGHVTAPDGTVWWFANPPSRRELTDGELRAVPQERWRRGLLRLFDGDALPARALLDATDRVFAWNAHDVPRVRTWHRDRVVLVGDAAHAISPSSGQGASLALEDAVTLARTLRDAPGVDAALTTYEQSRRRRVERAVAQGRQIDTGKASGPLGRAVRDRVLFPLASLQAGRTGRPPAPWLYEHHVAW